MNTVKILLVVAGCLWLAVLSSGCGGGARGTVVYKPELIGIGQGRQFYSASGFQPPADAWYEGEGRDLLPRAMRTVSAQRCYLEAYPLAQIIPAERIPDQPWPVGWQDGLTRGRVLVNADYSRLLLEMVPGPNHDLPVKLWVEYNVVQRRGEYIYLVADK